jgi:hypothetical protein
MIKPMRDEVRPRDARDSVMRELHGDGTAVGLRIIGPACGSATGASGAGWLLVAIIDGLATLFSWLRGLFHGLGFTPSPMTSRLSRP